MRDSELTCGLQLAASAEQDDSPGSVKTEIPEASQADVEGNVGQVPPWQIEAHEQSAQNSKFEALDQDLARCINDSPRPQPIVLSQSCETASHGVTQPEGATPKLASTQIPELAVPAPSLDNAIDVFIVNTARRGRPDSARRRLS